MELILTLPLKFVQLRKVAGAVDPATLVVLPAADFEPGQVPPLPVNYIYEDRSYMAV